MIEPRKFLPLLAATGLLITLHQLMDMVPLIAGVDLATPTSRVRLVLMLWGRSAALIVADVFLIAAAMGLGHRRALGVLGRLNQGSGIVLLLAVPFLLVSAGAMASTVGGNGLGMFRATMARVLVALLVAGLGSWAAGQALLRLPAQTPAPG